MLARGGLDHFGLGYSKSCHIAVGSFLFADEPGHEILQMVPKPVRKSARTASRSSWIGR